MTELTLAICIMLEAGGEKGLDPKAAVASVIWNNGKGNPSKMLKYATSGKLTGWARRHEDATWLPSMWSDTAEGSWAECRALAMCMVRGRFIPNVQSNMFYNPSMCVPDWADQLTGIRKIGAHIFGEIKKSKKSKRK